MQSPSIVTSAVTTAGLEDTEGQRNPSHVNLRATVAATVFITPVYVLIIFLWWKQRVPPQGLLSCLMALLVSLSGGNLDMAWILLLLLPAACLQAVSSRSTDEDSLAINRLPQGLYLNSSFGFIHVHFKDHLVLNWTQPQISGVLRILDLKQKDQCISAEFI
ncbi:hypothetical protein U0070_004337 [Myodes glareolus]|uniref:Uncharacterized protein n=1 Tax=Myodes glareolus TaxID=447135 RepID=A0AAW0GVJ5_MYOGA